MHGRVKVRSTAEQEELKRVERAQKLARYKAGIKLIFSKRKNGIWDDEILAATEEMVLKNPDIYTLWNIRREAFTEMKLCEEDFEDLLKKELTLTENCLRANPKSYSVWHQRCWVIDRLRAPDWAMELKLCGKCLNMDERNFHCWDYRQYVVKKAGVSELDEFKFSTIKIESNFSNYSSWHYRSLILSKLFPDPDCEYSINKEKRAEELDLVMNATFTDPNDTSAWFYQRWLLNPKQSRYPIVYRIKVCQKRVTLAFTRQVSLNSSTTWLSDDENAKLHIDWKSGNGQKFSSLWFAEAPNGVKSWNNDTSVKLTFNDTSHRLVFSADEHAWNFQYNWWSSNDHDLEQLTTQLDNYKQLADLEPDNKWVLLTGIVLMKNIDPIKYHDTIMEDLSSLRRIDKLRKNFYNDFRSKHLIDYALRKISTEEHNECSSSKADLSDMGLTVLCNEQYFGFFEEIDLSDNQLQNSLSRLYALHNCVRLTLSSNGLDSLQGFPTLRSLRYLSLRKNNLTDLDEILDLVRRHDLEEINLCENPICETHDLTNKLDSISSKLKVSYKQ